LSATILNFWYSIIVGAIVIATKIPSLLLK
jgi:hypothetical protein